MPDTHINSRIKKLSPLLINQLAAGEVVTRPAAVVKELLENAIDAEATDIKIHITQGGMGMIEVVDNGVGIHPDDMVMAITRHATSKVADIAHLQGITTLGFRGEALAATAAVSRLSLISSHDDSGIGRQLQVAGVLDEVPHLTPNVHHRGTTVTVKDLYFNVPARRGNLKSIATEFGHIETIVRQVALARADITLTLFHDQKKRLMLSAHTKTANLNDGRANQRLPLSRLEQTTALSVAEEGQEVVVDLSSLMQSSVTAAHPLPHQITQVSGWLWPAVSDESPKESLPKLLYVNGRLVKEPIISNQLRQLAQSAQLAHLGYALYFDLPAQWLNLNVHPSKQRIKIGPLNNILAHLSHAIRTKLKTAHAARSAASRHEPAVPTHHDAIDDSCESGKSLVSAASSSVKLSNSQQVQAPKHTYEVSNRQDFMAQSAASDTSSCGTNQAVKVDINASAVEDRSLRSDIRPLPVCLTVVTHLDDLIIDSAHAANTKNTKKHKGKALPWLLFYSQEHCVLISTADCQAKIRTLFDSQIYENSVFKKDQKQMSAADINQQLAAISTQLSVQDLTAFITDIEELLTNTAITSINTQQLAAFMLSSMSKHSP